MTALLWVLTYLVHSTVLGGVAAVSRRSLREFAAAETIWRAVLFLPLISATVALVSGTGLWTLALPGFGFSGGTAGAGLSSGPSSVSILVSIIAIGGAVLVVRDLAAFVWFVRRLGLRSAAPAGVVAIIQEISRRGAVCRTVRVTQSASLASPVLLGFGEICLPERAVAELTATQLRSLLAHELAHVVRRDSFWFATLALIESALFFQPLNRIARHELQRLAELACDDWAARQIADPAAVADCLIEVVTWSRRGPPAMAPGAVGTSGLTERVLRLVGPTPPSVGPARGVCLAALSAAVFALPVLPAPTVQSDAYRAGFEAGRRDAADRVARGLGPSAGTPPSAAEHKRRADLEQALQNRQRAR